jgi:hypothetical protein
MNINGHTVEQHFENRAPEVKATYAAILKAAKKLGPVKEGPEEDFHSPRAQDRLRRHCHAEGGINSYLKV